MSSRHRIPDRPGFLSSKQDIQAETKVGGLFDCIDTPSTNVDAVPVEITRHEKEGGLVTKIIRLKDGRPHSDGSQCRIARGVSSRVRLPDWRDFAPMIEQTPGNVAYSLGRMRADRADKCQLFTQRAVTETIIAQRADVTTRTKDMIEYEPGKAAFVLLDFDTKGMTGAARARLEELGGFLGALEMLLPGIKTAGYIRRASTSANLYFMDSFNPCPQAIGEHIYVLVRDGSDAKRFLDTLHDRAWLHGLGWIWLSISGAALERSITDRSVFGGERLNFEAAPDFTDRRLLQGERPAAVHDGEPLDTRWACPDLSADEVAEVKRFKDDAKAALGAERKQAERAFVEKKCVELVKRGVSPAKAERVAAQYLGGDLLPDVVLEFDDPNIGTVTVAEILEDPDRFIGETLPDPVEGRDYGFNCAILMRGGNAIWSWAHGGDVIYHLKHDFNTVKAAIEGAEENEARNVLVKLITRAVLDDGDKDKLTALAAKRDGVSKPAVKNIVKEAEAAEAKAKREEAQTRARAASSKPTITLIPGHQNEILGEIDAALVDDERIAIYRREYLVRPIQTELPASNGRKTFVAALKRYKAHDLCVAINTAANFLKPNMEEELKTADAPLHLAEKLLACADKSRLPVIAGLVSCPTLRPDGSVLSAPGFDAATAMYHFVDDEIDLSSLKDQPTRDDALEAALLLEGLLEEFPFVEAVDKAVALNAMITTATRAMFLNVPAHGFTAPEAGTGKSFLSDIISLIIGGKDCPVIGVCSEEEEIKQLSAALMCAYPIISLDNVNRPLGGGLLCQAVTQPIIALRPYGQNKETETIVNRSTIIANGNNLAIRDDMTRRVLISRLDAKVERPELRKFKQSPREMILANRGRYVAACLTIVRAYILAGCPGKLSPLASFERWSDTVRSALVWLGRPDVADTLNAAREIDPELVKLTAFMAALRNCYGVGREYGVLLRRVCDDARLNRGSEDCDEAWKQLSEAVSDITRRGVDGYDSTRLGLWLRSRKGKIIGGYRLFNESDGHSNVACWGVEGIDAYGNATGEDTPGVFQQSKTAEKNTKSE